ncbi:response regulator [Ectothiorhodospiraceae bacterium BW-2]|nr:response regulator [Ectothiorhodospiraceae bacterium BW-2]
MKHDPLILIIDSKRVFEQMAPVISRELNTTHIWHRETLAEAMEIIDGDAWLDLIFADWGRTGTKLVDAIRSDAENHHTPLVVMTSIDSTDKIKTAVKHGATAILSKPFLNKGLSNVIHQIVASQERRHGRRLHPDQQVTLDVVQGNGSKLTMQLHDISLTGIQFINQLKLTGSQCLDETAIHNRLCIGEKVVVKVAIAAYQIDMDAILVRMELDRFTQLDAQLLVTYRFTADHDERVDKLERLLDEYAARW